MKSRKILGLFLSSFLFLTSCSNLAKDNEEATNLIKLGMIIPQTGPVSNYGQSVQKGIDLAIKEINQSGGMGVKN